MTHHLYKSTNKNKKYMVKYTHIDIKNKNNPL